MAVKTGYDAPIVAPEEDLLDRRQFASEIAAIATSAPPEWSVRIGVYGGWGTGKSSALRLVESLIGSAHPVVWFNPWGYTDRNELWREFVQSVFGRLAQLGIEAPGAHLASVKKYASAALDHTLKLAKARQEADAVGAIADSFLRSWLQAGSEDLEQLRQALAGRRIVVIFDDVDRVDPKLLPQLFFSLRELLDLPGFSFILALDPVVVGRALGEHHKGWGDGLAFLDKIVDFPRWLSTPTPEALWRLASRDLARHCPHFPPAALEADRALLPENPRCLRSFVRSLWSLRAQMARYDADELDRSVLFLIHLLRERFPSLAEHVLSTDENVTTVMVSRFPSKNEKINERHDAELAALCAAGMPGAPPDEVARARALLEVASKGWVSHAPRSIRQYALLAEKAVALTMREYRAMRATWDGTDEGLRRAVEERARDSSVAFGDVARDAYRKAFREAHDHMERAITAPTAEAVALLASGSAECWRLASVLWRIGVSTQPGAFEEALGAASAWAHFRNHEAYVQLRDLEEETVRAFGRTLGPALAVDAYNSVLPTPYRGGTLRGNASIALVESVRELLGEPVAERALQAFVNPGGVEQVLRSNELQSVQHVILNHDGPLWQGRRGAFLALLGRADELPDLRRNLFEFLELFQNDHIREGGHAWASREQIRRLFTDKELIERCWEVLVQVTPNPRFVSSFRDISAAFREHAGLDLPVPAHWWSSEREDGEEEPD